MKFDRTKLVASYAGRFQALSGVQQKGLDALLTAAEADAAILDLRWLAYMLATVKHECAETWKPIEEFSKGKGHKYGEPVKVVDAQGNAYTNVYYGRGYVQLTWDYNYRKMGTVLGNRLLYQPDLALDPTVAYQIMSYGMRNGSFTGAKLAGFIAGTKCDYVNARKIINGLDRADLIAGYAVGLEAVLRDAASEPVAETPTDTFVATDDLYVRYEPDGSSPIVPGSPLPKGTVMTGIEDRGEWKNVSVQGSVNGVTDMAGWVAVAFLAPG